MWQSFKKSAKGGELKMDFKPGDVLVHKATRKRCVVVEIQSNGYVLVTTQDDENRTYKPHELKKRK